MSIEFEGMGSGAFGTLSPEDQHEVTQAIQRAERIDAYYRQAVELATYVEGLEARMLLQDTGDKKLLDTMRKLVVTTDQVRDQLSARLDDYRHTLRDAPRSMGWVGAFVQKLKLARNGDIEAVAALRSARDQLGAVNASPPPNGDGGARIALGTLFLASATNGQRPSPSHSHPRLEEAFALEESIAQAARDRLEPAACRSFMSRIRGNIAKDLDEGRPLPSISAVDAVLNGSR